MQPRNPLFQLANTKANLHLQYAGMTNYKNRKSDSLLEWYAAQYNGDYDLHSVDYILEIGCGDGSFWKYIANGQPFTPHVVITDLVPEMLADCKDNLSEVSIHADFQTADIDALPYGKASFGAVLAHKVIYHAANPEKSISDIQQILKPDGFFGLSVLNNGVYKSIWGLAHSIDEQIPDCSLSSLFSDTDANKILPRYFNSTAVHTYSSTKEYLTSDPVVEYVKTNPSVQPLHLSANFFSLFKEKVEDIIEDKGSFTTEYHSNLYICRK